MASGPITLWQIEGERWKQQQILFSWASKSLQMVNAAMKLRHLLLGRKLWQTRQHITKICLVKAIVFPVVMYGCERWSIRKAKCWRTDAFKLWWWRRLLRVHWTARRSNQSILKKINPKNSLERLKLQLQHFGHVMQRADSLERTLILGKSQGKRRSQQKKIR